MTLYIENEKSMNRLELINTGASRRKAYENQKLYPGTD
jgi:hypothetical protein